MKRSDASCSHGHARQLLSVRQHAENWPRFRGPAGIGVSSGVRLAAHLERQSRARTSCGRHRSRGLPAGRRRSSGAIASSSHSPTGRRERRSRPRRFRNTTSPAFARRTARNCGGRRSSRARKSPVTTSTRRRRRSPTARPSSSGSPRASWPRSTSTARSSGARNGRGPFNLNPNACASSPTLYEDTLLLLCDQGSRPRLPSGNRHADRRGQVGARSGTRPAYCTTTPFLLEGATERQSSVVKPARTSCKG